MEKHRARVILINLPTKIPFAGAPFDSSEEHIGLGYIAAYLKHKGINNILLLDAASRRLTRSEILRKIQKFNPNFICLSPTYLTLNLAINISEEIKALRKSCQIIFGGPHVSFEPVLSRALREHNCIDFVVRGEGEIVTYKIIKQAECPNPVQIPGVSYRNFNGKIVIAKDIAESIPNLDYLAFPLRDIEPLQGKSVRIATSRGCHRNGNGCSFCITSSLFPNGWKERSAENIIEELELLKKKGFNNFICAEADFFGFSKSGQYRALEIINKLQKRRLNIKLRIFAGIPQIIEAERFGIIRKLKNAGIERIYPGIESADLDTLKIFLKNHSPSEVYTAVAILKRRKIALQIGFIMFHPWSTIESLKENRHLLKHIDQAHLWHNFSHTLLLLPGSNLLKKTEKDNLLIKDLSEVGLGEEFVFNYRYVNNHVSKIYELCDQLHNNPTIISLDRMLITTEIKLSNYNDNMHIKVAELSNIFSKIKKEMGSINLDAFQKIKKLARKTHSHKEERLLLITHVSQAKKRVSILESALKMSSE